MMTTPQFKSAYKIVKRKGCIEFYLVLSIKKPDVRNVKMQHMKTAASAVLAIFTFGLKRFQSPLFQTTIKTYDYHI